MASSDASGTKRRRGRPRKNVKEADDDLDENDDGSWRVGEIVPHLRTSGYYKDKWVLCFRQRTRRGDTAGIQREVGGYETEAEALADVDNVRREACKPITKGGGRKRSNSSGSSFSDDSDVESQGSLNDGEIAAAIEAAAAAARGELVTGTDDTARPRSRSSSPHLGSRGRPRGARSKRRKSAETRSSFYFTAGPVFRRAHIKPRRTEKGRMKAKAAKHAVASAAMEILTPMTERREEAQAWRDARLEHLSSHLKARTSVLTEISRVAADLSRSTPTLRNKPKGSNAIARARKIRRGSRPISARQRH